MHLHYFQLSYCHVKFVPFVAQVAEYELQHGNIPYFFIY